MVTFRAFEEIKEDRQVVLKLPVDTPVGAAELWVTATPRAQVEQPSNSLEEHFGAVNSGDPHSADAERIDSDLARAYGSAQDGSS